jgi:cyclopropane-fatty-acyl-phospholipid synthase
MATIVSAESIRRPQHAGVLSRLRRRLARVSVPPFEVRLEDGTVHQLAGGSVGGDDLEPRFRLTIRRQPGLRALLSLDELRLAIAYLQGDIDVDGDFLSCLDLRAILTDRHPIQSLQRFLKPLLFGQRRSDLAWVPKHYDHGNEFYFAFLDKQFRMYSQALYKAENESLEQAVRNKLEYIVDICRLRPGSHVLDIGGGWGAFERYVGPKGVNSTMLTISHEQYAFLSAWCKGHGMPCRLGVVRESIFAYEPPERFDAIVLLGVMEHLPDYPELFARFNRLLTPVGRVYMDFAAGRQKYRVSSFTYRYVFEGNHTPVYLPGLFQAANENGFEPIALHNDRHSYYLTLQAWARNLEAARDVVLPIVGEHVYRLFRLYLWGGAHLLQRNGLLESYRVVFQRAAGRPSSEIGCYRPV